MEFKFARNYFSRTTAARKIIPHKFNWNFEKWAENDKIWQKILKNGLKIRKIGGVREFKVREIKFRAKYIVREF